MFIFFSYACLTSKMASLQKKNAQIVYTYSNAYINEKLVVFYAGKKPMERNKNECEAGTTVSFFFAFLLILKNLQKVKLVEKSKRFSCSIISVNCIKSKYLCVAKISYNFYYICDYT